MRSLNEFSAKIPRKWWRNELNRIEYNGKRSYLLSDSRYLLEWITFLQTYEPKWGQMKESKNMNEWTQQRVIVWLKVIIALKSVLQIINNRIEARATYNWRMGHLLSTATRLRPIENGEWHLMRWFFDRYPPSSIYLSDGTQTSVFLFALQGDSTTAFKPFFPTSSSSSLSLCFAVQFSSISFKTLSDEHDLFVFNDSGPIAASLFLCTWHIVFVSSQRSSPKIVGRDWVRVYAYKCKSDICFWLHCIYRVRFHFDFH